MQPRVDAINTYLKIVSKSELVPSIILLSTLLVNKGLCNELAVREMRVKMLKIEKEIAILPVLIPVTLVQ
jgi:hypothetical protein